MKFIVSILLIALLSFVACLYAPWWSIAIAGFVVTAFIHQPPGLAFIAGFLAVFFLWSGLAWWINMRNGEILAHKVSVLLLTMDNPPLLIAATGVVGGLIAGLGALTGGYLNKKL